MAQGIVINISGSGAGAAEALRQIEAKMQESAERGKESAATLGEAWEKVEGILDAFAIRLAARDIIDGFKEMIAKTIETVTEIGHLSEQTGISTQNLSVLKYAASVTGVEFDSLTKGFKKMSTEVANADSGLKTSQKSFTALGISMADLRAKGNDMYGVLMLVADKFKEMPDGIEKNAIATQMFGRAGEALIPILNSGSAAIASFKASAPIVTGADVAKMGELREATTEYKSSILDVQIALATALTPAMSAYLELTAEGIDTIKEGWEGFYKSVIDGSVALGMLAHGASLDQIKAVVGEYNKLNFGAAPEEPPKKPRGNPGAAGTGDGGMAAANRTADVDGAIERFYAEMARKDEAYANQLVAAQLRITEAGGKAQLAAVKSGASERLAELEAERQKGTITESAYLQDKLKIVEAENAAEVAALNEKRASLQAAVNGAGAGTPRQLELQAQLIQVNSELNSLANSRLATEAQISAQMQLQAAAAQLRAGEQAEYQRQIQQQLAAKQAAAAQFTADSGQTSEKLNAAAARQAAQTVGGFMDQLTSQALKGKLSFKSMVDSAIMDLERFAMKVIEERTLIPVMNALFGIGSGNGAGSFNLAGAQAGNSDLMSMGTGDETLYQLPAYANGGDISSGWAVVGDGGNGSGSELFAPKGPGTILPHDVLEGLASAKGSSGGAPSVVINNMNNSSAQVQMKQGSVSWDGAARQFVVHTILEDMQQGGPLSSAMQGFAPK